MRKILLTGGSGFIGKNILESDLAVKYEIIAPRHKQLDLADTESVDRFFSNHKIDYVIHAAVKPGHRNAPDLSNLFLTNTRMFFNLERHSSEYEKMIVIGSGAIYDGTKYRPKMSEEEWLKYIPQDEHGYCKYVCEKVIQNSRNIYDLRVFGIFGKYEDYAIRFISNAICKAIFDLPITIKQNRKFDYIYVNDLIPVLDWFIQHTPLHHSYNITPDESISLLDLAKIVRKVADKNELPIQIAQDGDGLEYSGENSLIKAEYSAYAMRPIEESVQQLYSWYCENKDKIDINNLLVDK